LKGYANVNLHQATASNRGRRRSFEQNRSDAGDSLKDQSGTLRSPSQTKKTISSEQTFGHLGEREHERICLGSSESQKFEMLAN
jgi:hypothetical protein